MREHTPETTWHNIIESFMEHRGLSTDRDRALIEWNVKAWQQDYPYRILRAVAPQPKARPQPKALPIPRSRSRSPRVRASGSSEASGTATSAGSGSTSALELREAEEPTRPWRLQSAPVKLVPRQPMHPPPPPPPRSPQSKLPSLPTSSRLADGHPGKGSGTQGWCRSCRNWRSQCFKRNDWICWRCDNHNFAGKKKCNRCKEARHAETFVPDSDFDLSRPCGTCQCPMLQCYKPWDWMCSCGNHNYANREAGLSACVRGVPTLQCQPLRSCFKRSLDLEERDHEL